MEMSTDYLRSPIVYCHGVIAHYVFISPLYWAIMYSMVSRELPMSPPELLNAHELATGTFQESRCMVHRVAFFLGGGNNQIEKPSVSEA